MIKTICIKNYKALRDTQTLRIGNMTLLTGVNGRGKSSFLQMLLLLSQSVLRGDVIDSLILNGEWIQMGSFDDIVNSYSKDKKIKIILGTDNDIENQYEFSFAASDENEQIGKLMSFGVNGQEILEPYSADERVEDLEGNAKEAPQMEGSISDYIDLQNLRRLYYIAADRHSAPFETKRVSTNLLWNPQGDNVMQFVSQMKKEQFEEVGKILSEIFDGATFKTDMPDGSSQVLLYLDSMDNGNDYRPVHVGYGFSYVLSLIVAGIVSKEGETIIIENPEAHLHPTAQSHLMNWYLSYVIGKGVQVFVETHSDHIVNTTLLAVKDGTTRNGVEILYFDRMKGTEDVYVSNLELTSTGVVKNPPIGFCDQYANDLLNLMS